MNGKFFWPAISCVMLVIFLSICISIVASPVSAAQQADYYPVESRGEPIVHPAEIRTSPAGSEFQNGLTLDALQSMALSRNPTIAQAMAQVDAAQGAAFQAGLPRNPHVGYVAEQIGVNGTAGELQGGFVSQEFVRGNKLGLSRGKYCERVSIAQTNLAAQQARVKNDVAVRFYHTLGAQLAVDVHQRMVETAHDNVLTHNEMLNMGQTGEADVLQAEVELQREELKLKQSRNKLDQTWRDLIAHVGIPEMQPTSLVGSFEPASGPVEWDMALGQLLSGSPQVIAAQQKIRHDELAVQRERVEPIPNLTLDVTVGNNAEANQTVAGVSVGMPIPVFNRNRGTVRQAQADLNRSHAEVDRLQLELRAGLAKHYSDYVSAWQRVTEYRQSMLPKSRNAVDMLEQSYKDRRAPWTSVLSAKRMLLELELEQIENVLSFQMADVAIRGNLLTGGLTEPAGPISGGHIDAVSQPR